MQIDIKKSWNRYIQLYLNYYVPSKVEEEEVLPSLRDKLFLSILLFSFPICLLVYIPTIIISFTTNEFILGIFNSIALLFVLFIIMDRQQSIHSKKLFFSVVFYLLAVVLILFLGIEGPGMIILICTSVLITLYHSKIAGLISVASNALLFVFLLEGMDLDTNNFEYFHQFSMNTWIGVGINLIAFNILVVLAVDTLLEELNDSLLKEKDLQSLLMAESLKLSEAKQKAEESDRLKSAFLANMSHEIRTPMNGILGFLDLLADTNLKGDDRQIYIQIIQKSGDRLLNIIGEIVEMSKIESGAMEISIHGSNINSQLRNIFTQLKPEAESKGIWLELSNGLPDDEANVKTDEEKLRAILTKLVRNAIKFTNHGKIEFGYQLKTFDPEEEIQHPSELEFFVKDTGIGIPEDRQEAIFERFIQADISDVKARQGAGLGLSIAKNYVEMLGGTIWVESEQEKGSTFHFSHPYHVEIPELSPSEPNDWTENKNDGLNILIVDDDEASGILIEMILENVSKNIFFAKSGTEAIHICRNNPDIDLILMDIQMPVVTGHETTRQIREFNKEVVIIAQTAHALTGDREKALLAGCNDYIPKPINKEELMLLIQKHFQNSKNISFH